MGAATSLALGTAGAFMGAFLSCAAANQGISELHVPGLVGGVCGAIALMCMAVRLVPRGATVRFARTALR
jgi:uncharacterized membrane protein YeaQ/YmgE (transglycosylase-associated protein family)